MAITRWRGPQRWRGVQTWRGFLADLAGGVPESGSLKWTEPGTKTTTYAGAVRSEVKVSVPSLASLTFDIPPRLVTTGAAQTVTTRAAQAPSPSARFAPTSAPTVAANVAQAATVARSDTSAPRVNAAPSNEPRVGSA